MTGGKLWIISELYYPEQTSTGYFLTGIGEGLAQDRDVQIICSKPTYSERGMNVPRMETRAGTTIHRMRSTSFDKDRVLGRVINLITFTISTLIFFAFHAKRGDTMLVVTNPPSLPPLLAIIASLKKMRSILLVHDVYPEVLAATGYVSPHSFAYRALYGFFARTYRRFSDVVVLGRDMEKLARRKIGGARTRLSIIPNWGDVDQVTPMPRRDNPFAQAHDLADKTIVQFSGNMGRTHDLELVLELAERLSARTDIVFLFVGYGGKTRLVDAERGKRANIRLLPRQPREMLGPMLACANATIISFVDGMFGVSVPSRMYNVMAAGVPIIAVAHPDSELSLLVEESGAGWTFGSADVSRIQSLILSLAESGGAAEAEHRGSIGRHIVEKSFTSDRIIAQFRALLSTGECQTSQEAPHTSADAIKH